APRRRRGVVIQDPKEKAASIIMHSEVKKSKRHDNTMMRYQALKRKLVTEAQARKNMMISLKNMVGFKMDFFKGMTYSEIRPIFEKHYNLMQAFLEKEKEVTVHEKEIEEEEPKNFSDDFLLNILKIRFEKPDIEANVWKDHKGRYRLAKQMLDNVRLEVEEESEMSLELLRLVRRQLNEGCLVKVVSPKIKVILDSITRRLDLNNLSLKDPRTVSCSVMSSPTHPTPSDVDEEYAFPSANILDYTLTLPNYFLATPGNISSDFLENSKNDEIPHVFSPFYNNPYMKDMQAFYAKESPIPPPDPITPPINLTPSIVLPASLLFDP
nr:hypothetical protein [Tanacetum cinerariifolium]